MNLHLWPGDESACWYTMDKKARLRGLHILRLLALGSGTTEPDVKQVLLGRPGGNGRTNAHSCWRCVNDGTT